ncbi:MAG: hypothetical protein HZB76_03325 [Chlamydiae bacterium]|nr:hypothetical protein [Chlamydiota bacterium]
MSTSTPSAANGPTSQQMWAQFNPYEISMSIPTSATKKVWAQFSPYINPPLAAMAAIVPVFYGFAAKSAQQLGLPIPRMSVRKAVEGGWKAIPAIGITVGLQMVGQGFVENAIMGASDKKDQKPSFATMLIGSAIVGGISAIPLAVFNGKTMEKTARQALMALSAKQVGVIISRETIFLLSIRMIGPLSAYMKHSCGENKAVDYGSAFASGAIGSIIGHPFDTALTLWQKGMEVKNVRQLMRGCPMKALAVGGFSVCYKAANELLESASKK